ncbi:hypothetical protein CRENBAI_004317 [Crenichthys baileyi]|uniref:Uncharacterized protein n=1 Tax=Crenichthys baileyi TaxID=28760 RepID=A0AAV9RGI6_9TELE
MLRKRCPGRRSLKKRPQSTSGKEKRFTRVVETASLLGTFLEPRVRLQGSERKPSEWLGGFGFARQQQSWRFHVVQRGPNPGPRITDPCVPPDSGPNNQICCFIFDTQDISNSEGTKNVVEVEDYLSK